MKKFIASLFSICILIMTIQGARGLSANGATASTNRPSSTTQTGEPRTIADYFLLIPERYLSVRRAERPALLRRLESNRREGSFEIDVANGFMAFQDHAEEQQTLALFRRPDGQPLIAITYYGMVIRRGEPQDIARLYFLSYDPRTRIWHDVTRQTLPLPFNRNLRYHLPRRGTTIEVYGEGDRKVYDLVWSQGRFTVRRAPRGSNEH